MIKDCEIKPGIGLGQIIFGMKQSDVIATIGEPEEEVKNNDYKNEIDITWYYDNANLSLYFDEDDNYRLRSIIVENPKISLWNRNLNEFSKNQIIKLLSDKVGKEYEEKESEDEVCIEVDSIGLNFYLENDKLVSVQIGVLFADENTIKWPDLLRTSCD